MNDMPLSTPPSTPPSEAHKTSDELAQIRTDLAVDRTLMAADRSLMAWVRTGLSMISFGFTIYKVIEGFHQEGGGSSVTTARDVGLFLTGLGIVAVVMGTIEYWSRLKALRKEPSERYLTAAQFAGDVQAFLDGHTVSARHGTYAYRAGKFAHRHRIAILGAATVALSLVAGVGGLAQMPMGGKLVVPTVSPP